MTHKSCFSSIVVCWFSFACANLVVAQTDKYNENEEDVPILLPSSLNEHYPVATPGSHKPGRHTPGRHSETDDELSLGVDDCAIFGKALKGIQFESGTANLTAEAKRHMQRPLKVLQKHKDIKIEIVAHTDSIGGEEENQRLSEARAQAVQQYFVDSGIAKSNLLTTGWGETKPIADNKTIAGRAKNRRVELKIQSAEKRMFMLCNESSERIQ